jgi:glycosyltransferase involved in cell wall biosynthesis
MDGDSTDGTLEILGEYPDLIWVSEPDRGQSHALNKGLHRCTGDIVGWLNADDTYQPGAVGAAVDFLAQHPEIDAVYTDLQVVDGDGKPLRLSQSEPFSLERLLFFNFVKQPTVFIRRAVIDAVGDANENLHYVMDWELWIRAGMRCRFGYLQGPVFANFRICPGTKTAEKTPEFLAEQVVVLKRLLETSPCCNLSQSLKRRALRRAKAKIFLFRLFSNNETISKARLLGLLLSALGTDPMLSLNAGLWFRSLQRLLGRKRSSSRPPTVVRPRD